MKMSGDLAIDKVIAKINKDFGRDFIGTRPIVSKTPMQTSGILGLDCATGGGLPVGKIVEIYGPEACGKTSLTLFWASLAQRDNPDKYVLIVDKEHSMVHDFIMGFGLDPKRIIYMRPDTTKEALDPLLSLVRTGRFCYLGFDSIGALAPPNAVEKSVVDANVGGVSKILVNFFTEFNQICDATGCTSVFINQMRYNPGQMFGN